MMEKAERISVGCVDKLKTHKFEIIVEFVEPITYWEAQDMVLEALSGSLYGIERAMKNE